MPELLLCCALRWSHSRLFFALPCCLLLLQLCLLVNHLRSYAFSPFSTGFCEFRIFHTSLSPIFHTSLSPFFLHKVMRFLILSFISLTWWSLCMGATLPILLPVFRHRVVHQFTSMLFVVDDCRNFFPVEHFGASIPVFSARFSVVFSCFNFAFCSTTYVRPLSHLSLLGFVTFVFFTLRCHLFFILRYHLFFLHKVMRFLILCFISLA